MEVEAERAAEVAAREIPAEDPTERLERVQQRIDELDKLMAAFAPADIHVVEEARDQLASAPVNDLVSHPEAQSLADEIAAVDAQLRAAPAMTGGADALAVVRTRLDDARHALLVAEQAVRNPELDRGMVEQLEQAHAELIEAIDRADSRFGGARAQRRVEALRSAEQAILDELGFTSYSDYMMGYSLLHVDPEKEAALDAAREELSDAEDAWHVLEAETEAELAARRDRRGAAPAAAGAGRAARGTAGADGHRHRDAPSTARGGAGPGGAHRPAPPGPRRGRSGAR